MKPCGSHHRSQNLFLDLCNIHFLKTIVNSVTITKLQKLFVKTNCVLAKIEPMLSCLDSCIPNKKLQIQLQISLICLKVSELWNSKMQF
jgi:hypothetical protein